MSEKTQITDNEILSRIGAVLKRAAEMEMPLSEVLPRFSPRVRAVYEANRFRLIEFFKLEWQRCRMADEKRV